MPVPKDIEATIYFLSPEEGGRKKPAYSGYRPQFYYDDQDWVAAHIYPDVDAAMPGETVRTYLGFLNPKEHVDKLYLGMEFLIREGPRTVGKGCITEIIELKKSAQNASQ